MSTPQQNPESAESAPKIVRGLKSYQYFDFEKGEVVCPYKYLEGHPKQYRFDAKEGLFSIHGIEQLGDTFTFQPIAWRIFSDNILRMGTKNWAEIFFMDEKNCVSALLFHGYSVDNMYKLIEPLFYDDLTLADVVITAKAEKKENTKITPKGVYYIAGFSYQLAPREKVQEVQDFVRDNKIFRQETLTDLAHIKVASGFYNPLAKGSADLIHHPAPLTA
jgi:hypothetical protein